MNGPRCNCSPESDHVGNVYHQRHCAMLPRLRGLSAARGGEASLAAKLCALNVERYHGRRATHPHRKDDTEMFYDEPWTRYDWSTKNPPTGTVVPSQREARGYCDFHAEMAARFAEHGIGAARGGAPTAPSDELADVLDEALSRYDFRDRQPFADGWRAALAQVRGSLAPAPSGAPAHEPPPKCPVCDGVGWTTEADPRNGDPTQVQCEPCYGTGRASVEKVLGPFRVRATGDVITVDAETGEVTILGAWSGPPEETT